MTEGMHLLIRLGLGLVLSSLIALLAYWREALDRSGAIGAIVTGTIIFGLGGWTWGALLITFFVLSTLLSKYKAGTKAVLAEKFAKGSRRDLGQVLANDGAGTLLAVLFAITGAPALLPAFVGAMATVTADTWATEIGVLSKRSPRLLTSWQIVDPGTSGGISMLGTAATLAGGLTIGGAASGFAALVKLLGGAILDVPAIVLVAAGVLGGLVGSLFDSFLGATIQAIYYSEGRAKETEKPVDPDGTVNRLLRGQRWLNNDWVNFISSVVGAVVGMLAAVALT